MRSPWMLAACAAVALAAALPIAAAAQTAAPYVLAAIADKNRPPEDVQRDPDRKPEAMLAFAGIRPGMTVVDFLPGRGYFTRIFAKAVGPRGTVLALYPPPEPSGDPSKPTPAAETIAADPAYANVKPVRAAFTAVVLPVRADIFWTSQNYHDLHNVAGLDMAVFNKAVFAALKPGGVYVVLDHVGAPGDPAITHTLHRIDPRVVRQEVEQAGFVYVGESRVLRNPADDHSLKIFDPLIRGHTDQFVFKFRKPG